MAGTNIDLSFLNDGNNLTLTIAQLQAMDAQLRQIGERSPALIELSRTFGITYQNAQKLTAELGVGPSKLREAVGTLQQLRGAGADAVTQFAVLSKNLGLTEEQMRLLADQVDELGGKKDVVQNLAGAFSALFVVNKVEQFKNSVLETGKVLEGLQTRLLTTLGTKAGADSALDRIQKFASTTPFEMVEVTDAFVKLKSRGIDPSNDALRSLGDLASSQGKGLNQTVEALLDASQGEFERLKEYGIKASAAGDKVNISFGGMNRQIERTPEGITAGILALGKFEGVAGGMELQSKTLGGALSNLGDAQTKLAGEMFALVQGPAIALVQTSTKLIDTFSELDPTMKGFILTTAGVGAVLVSAVAALAAFQAAQIGAALTAAAGTLAETPAALARGVNTAITKLATLAEWELVAAKQTINGVTTGGILSTVLDTKAKGANALATLAQNAATKSGLATMASGKLAMTAGAAAAGILALTVIGAAASIALLADTLRASTAPEAELAKSNESLAKSMKATSEATEKAIKSDQAKANSAAALAEATRRASLSNAERAAEDLKGEADVKVKYEQIVNDKIGIFQRFLDKVREFISLPNQTLVKTFELVAKLPLPGPIKEFFSGMASNIDKLRLQTVNEAFKDSDSIARADVFDKADAVDAQKRTVKSRVGGSLGNATKAEVEGLAASYQTQIEAAEKMNVVDASTKAQKDILIKSLKAEQAEVAQSIKLIQEKEKRITAVGAADAQWAAETKKVTSNMVKQIATSEDANKLIETTKKQLENGFITPEQAAAAFASVADYTQATADVQITAANELNAVRAKSVDRDKAVLENRIQLAEIDGITQVKSAEQTASATAKIRAEQAALEVKAQQDKLDLLTAQGRASGKDGLEAEKALSKAKLDAKKADAEAEVAAQKEAIASINKALSDAADARQSVELKASTAEKKKSIKSIKSGESSSEAEAERIDTEAAGRQAAALEQEVTLKISKQKELRAVGGKDATDQAKKLGLEILGLQDKQADLELAALKRLQKQKLDELAKAVEKTKALNALAQSESELTLAQKELDGYRQVGADRKAIDEDIAKARVEAQVEKAQGDVDAIDQELAGIRKLEQEKTLSAEEAAKKIRELETKRNSSRAGLAKAELDQVKAEEAAKTRAIADALKDRVDADTQATASATADLEKLSASAKLAASRGDGGAIAAQLRGEFDLREGLARKQAEVALRAAQAEQESLEERITANLVADKDIGSERLKASTKVAEAEIKLTEITIAVERKQREEAHKLRLNRLEEIKQSLQKEQELITQTVALNSALAGLESAQGAGRDIILNSRKQELALAKEIADAQGNKGLSSQLEQKTKELELSAVRAQAEEIKRQFDLKRASLELDIKSKEIASEQLVLEKEMSLLEAQSALDAGRAEGKSAAELANLAKKVEFAQQGLTLANKSQANTKQIADLQTQTLGIERGNALGANAQQVRAAEVKAALGDKSGRSRNFLQGVLQSGASQSTTVSPTDYKALDPIAPREKLTLPPPDYSSVNAASKILETTFTDLSSAAKTLFDTKPTRVETPDSDPFVAMFGQKFDQLDKTLREAILQRDGEFKAQGGTRGAPLAGSRENGGQSNPGTYLVGEQGPELVTFARQAYVHTAAQTSQLLAGAATSKPAEADPSQAQLLLQLQKLNDQVSKRSTNPGAINVPVNVTTNDTNAIAQALAIVRADRAARFSSSVF